jgi:hypothetical protein
MYEKLGTWEAYEHSLGDRRKPNVAGSHLFASQTREILVHEIRANGLILETITYFGQISIQTTTFMY